MLSTHPGSYKASIPVKERPGYSIFLSIGDEAIVETGGYALPGQVLQDAERVRGEHTAVEVRRVSVWVPKTM